MATKEDLFLKEIESLVYAYGGTHWDWYALAVPIRKWYIKTYIKRMEDAEKKSGADNMDKPLSQSERMKFVKQAQQVQNDPSKMKNFMQPVRNK